MKDFLFEIVEWKRHEVELFKEAVPVRQLIDCIDELPDEPGMSMRDRLLSSDTGVIAEFKRRSPSKGWIKEDGRAEIIPLSYQQNGAAALSILTDEKFFAGSDRFIVKARRSGVNIPVLYKNFVIDDYQLLQAKMAGASAVLLIAAVLSKAECKALITNAHNLGLEVLLELHDERELDYADLDADMIGVNNRHLGTFITDVDQSYKMIDRLPQEACKVSESGISNPSTIVELRSAGYRGFLIGESFMRTDNPGQTLAAFIEEMKK